MSKITKADSKAYGMTLVVADGNAYKDMIAGRMKRPNGRGSWMVYAGCDTEYAEQVTAEHKVNIKKNGVVKQVWVPKRSHVDNHYLDAEVYALVAADIRGVRTLHLLQEDVDEVQTQKEEDPDAPEEQWIKANENWLGGARYG